MTAEEIKRIEAELDESYKDCVKANWSTATESYYVGQKRLLEAIGFEIKRTDGKHKIGKK